MLQKRENNKKKIYAYSGKPLGHKVLSFYILDILLFAMRCNHPPLSVSGIRKCIHRRFGINYSSYGIYTAINCIANMQEVQLHITESHTGTAVKKDLTKHFSITIKTTDNEPGQNT